MLYPKNNEPFSPALFKNPTGEYRGAPFWAWNTELNQEDLLWQIEQLKAMGYGGFHMHVRTGLATPYLSDEYMALIKACVEKAHTENMLAWLYDEDRWPSGAAGGLVTQKSEYRARYLLLTQTPYSAGERLENHFFSGAQGQRTGKGRLVAVFDVSLDDNGRLCRYQSIQEDEKAAGIKLYAYLETAPPSPWFNNQTYVNTLDAAAIAEFIQTTHERYHAYLQNDFGHIVPAIFTDEPQFSHKGTLSFASENTDVFLPWTDDLPETFQKTFSENLIAALPELLWEPADKNVPSRIRYHYHDHVAERFARAFADQCGAWCEEHGIMLTGHMMEEATLASQTAALGDAMRSLRAFQLPGIDMLCDQREWTTAKQAQSVARQYGRPGVLSELYGVNNWDFDFRGHKLQGDWQAALGVTVRVPHLSWVSMNGEAKRDYPASFNYQSPWYREYPYIENHFARVATALTRGSSICRVAVIHPVESYWLYWGDKENTAEIRAEMERNFQHLTEWLLRGLIDFDFISESLLPVQCDLNESMDAGFPVGQMRYDVVIVPNLTTVRGTTLQRLKIWRESGGRVLCLGDAPKFSDAVPCADADAFFNTCERVPFQRLPLINALEDLREVSIFNGKGERAEQYVHQLRKDGDNLWLFIAQADKPADSDVTGADCLRIRIRGAYTLSLCDTLTGEIKPQPAARKNGWTQTRLIIYAHDSVLLCAAGATGDIPEVLSPIVLPDFSREGNVRLFSDVPIQLSEPNVLLLDMAEYALDTEEFRPPEEILRLDNKLRRELGWVLRGEAVAQPWVSRDVSTPHTLRLRYRVHSDLAIENACLALENARTASATLNGVAAQNIDGRYVDKCIGKKKLPDIQPGENILEISMPYGSGTDVEACYLLGDFGVRVQGVSHRLIEPIKKLSFGDITRQGLPFYGGNISYIIEAHTGAAFEIAAPYYRGHLLKLVVNGTDWGVIAFAPYRLLVNGLTPGVQKIELIYFGSRVNTFGQLHRNDRTNQWWGPSSWRTEGDAWSYEYRFWPQGILKAPEIITLAFC